MVLCVERVTAMCDECHVTVTRHPASHALLQDGDTVLHCAVEGGSIEVVTLFLSNSSNSNSSNSSSSSSSSKSSDRLISDRSSLINRVNKHSVSPICIAAARLDVPMLNVLLKHGADVRLGKWRGSCALGAVAKKVGGGGGGGGCV